MKNSFYTTLYSFEDQTETSTHWSRSMNQSYANGISNLPYYQSQIMEQSVIEEVATLSGIAFDDLLTLNYKTSGRIAQLKDEVAKVHPFFSFQPQTKCGEECRPSTPYSSAHPMKLVPLSPGYLRVSWV